ncbi:thioesterase family protein [Mycolicibacterium sp. 22603]|uniref:thioesterase family protein n=1 Tax=Mycolicibacterium sp. 22603 TaxID=3453950 RepID=UPI003F824F10
MTMTHPDDARAPHYRRLGSDGEVQLFESTTSTASNWGTAIQHGSPPLALLTKAVEELYADRPQLRVGRLLLDILGAVPVAPVRVRAWVQRPGARISLGVAEMCPADAPDRPVARLSAWLLATSDTADVRTDRHAPLTEGVAVDSSHGWLGAPGYLETVSWRNQATEPDQAAVAWMSPLVPLVDDEPTTPLQRMAQVVDSANGIGAVLDPVDFAFMNTDTAVYLHRIPRGADFGLRARASIGPDGIGVTTAEIFDRDGHIGTSAQTLLVQRTR